MNAAEFAAKVRGRHTLVGYWIVLDSPPSTERIARLGYDYVSLDAQHGLFGYSGMLAGLTAIDAAGQAVGMVRVAANDLAQIGRALDAGAAGVIVPLVSSAEEAAARPSRPAGTHRPASGPTARRARCCGSVRRRPRPTPPSSCSP